VKELLEETSTQQIFWDDEIDIVWGVLHGGVHTLDHAEENIDAQERIRERLGRQMTRVLVDIRPLRTMTKEAREYYAN
jgi:hypothetical protein